MLAWFLFDLVLAFASVNLSCLIKSDLLFSRLHVFCFSHSFNTKRSSLTAQRLKSLSSHGAHVFHAHVMKGTRPAGCMTDRDWQNMFFRGEIRSPAFKEQLVRHSQDFGLEVLHVTVFGNLHESLFVLDICEQIVSWREKSDIPHLSQLFVQACRWCGEVV